MAFSKLKAMLRAKAERTIDALWTTVGTLIDRFEPTECANYFKAAGYDASRSENALYGGRLQKPKIPACPKFPEDISPELRIAYDELIATAFSAEKVRRQSPSLRQQPLPQHSPLLMLRL